jgi:chaperone required for assembly of F1-ATPase
VSDTPSTADPAREAPRRPELPKRFYGSAAAAPVEGGFGIHLDGRPTRTPARALLIVPSQALGEAIAAEWNAQETIIDPATMPLTRIVNAGIDGVAQRLEEVRDAIVSYAGTDMICYRADGPQTLVERQKAHWDGLLDWVREALGARFLLAEGVMPVAQNRETLERFGAALAGLGPLALAGLNVATTLTGSAIIALAVQRGRLSPEDAWAAAHVDEDWEIAQWGEDVEAAAKRAGRWLDMQAAALIMREAGTA